MQFQRQIDEAFTVDGHKHTYTHTLILNVQPFMNVQDFISTLLNTQQKGIQNSVKLLAMFLLKASLKVFPKASK